MIGHQKSPAFAREVLLTAHLDAEPLLGQRPQHIEEEPGREMGVETELVDLVVTGDPPTQEGEDVRQATFPVVPERLSSPGYHCGQNLLQGNPLPGGAARGGGGLRLSRGSPHRLGFPVRGRRGPGASASQVAGTSRRPVGPGSAPGPAAGAQGDDLCVTHGPRPRRRVSRTTALP